MKLTFLGTGTSMGVPVAGGFGGERITADPRNNRWRCSVWIQTDAASVLIDAGPEFRLQTLRSGLNRIDLVLITHEHMDHISGLDDLRPFCYNQNQSIPIYSSQTVIEAIKKQFDYMFGPDRYPGAASLDLQRITEQITYKDVIITPLPANHGNVDVLGFRLNDIAYLTDVKSIPETTKKKIKGSKLLVLSGLRWEPKHPTHMTIPEAVEAAEEMEIPQTYLIHMNGFVNHAQSNRKLPDHVQLAYDQLTVRVE